MFYIMLLLFVISQASTYVLKCLKKQVGFLLLHFSEKFISKKPNKCLWLVHSMTKVMEELKDGINLMQEETKSFI